jgi:hypothetical protein
MRPRASDAIVRVCRIACACGLIELAPVRGDAQTAPPITSFEQMNACLESLSAGLNPVSVRACADRAPASIRLRLMACVHQAKPFTCIADVFAAVPFTRPSAAQASAAPPVPTASPEQSVAPTASATAGGVPASLVPPTPSAGGVAASLVPATPFAGDVPASLVPATPPAGDVPSSVSTALPTGNVSTRVSTTLSTGDVLSAAPTIQPESGSLTTTTAVVGVVASGLVGLVLGLVLRRPQQVTSEPLVMRLDQEHRPTSPSLRIVAPLEHSIAIARQPVTFEAHADPPELAATIRWVVETQPAIPIGIGPAFTATFGATGVEQVVAHLDRQGLACDVIVYVFKTPEGGSTLADLLRSERPPVARDVATLHRYGRSAGGPSA